MGAVVHHLFAREVQISQAHIQSPIRIETKIVEVDGRTSFILRGQKNKNKNGGAEQLWQNSSVITRLQTRFTHTLPPSSQFALFITSRLNKVYTAVRPPPVAEANQSTLAG